MGVQGTRTVAARAGFAVAAALVLAVACTDGSAPESEDAAPSTSGAEAVPSQGVTDTEVAVGVAWIDAQEILDQFGVDIGVYPVEDLFQALAEGTNDRGGVADRELRVVTSTFLPTVTEETDRVCAELLQDEEVFVVAGTLLADQPLCVTELHGQPYVGAFGETPEIQERSEGRFFAVEFDFAGYTLAAVREMVDAGDLDGREVGLYSDANELERNVVEDIRDLLDDAGVSVVSQVEGPALTEDPVAADAAVDTAIERMRADGADLVLTPSTPIAILRGVERTGWEVDVAMTNGQLTGFAAEDVAVDPAVLERTIAVSVDSPTADEAREDEGIQACVADYDAAFPDDPLDLDNDDVATNVAMACRTWDLTLQILEAAGPELDVASFVAAAEGLGTFALPLAPDASLGPDKHSATSTIRRYVYDPEEGHWVRDGDAIPVEP